jgi:hypothetical protein
LVPYGDLKALAVVDAQAEADRHRTERVDLGNGNEISLAVY